MKNVYGMEEWMRHLVKAWNADWLKSKDSILMLCLRRRMMTALISVQL